MIDEGPWFGLAEGETFEDMIFAALATRGAIRCSDCSAPVAVNEQSLAVPVWFNGKVVAREAPMPVKMDRKQAPNPSARQTARPRAPLADRIVKVPSSKRPFYWRGASRGSFPEKEGGRIATLNWERGDFTMSGKRAWVLAAVLMLALPLASAHAGGVRIGIGIGIPVFYRPYRPYYPVYVAPAPIYYAPAPVYIVPAQPPAYVQPAPTVIQAPAPQPQPAPAPSPNPPPPPGQ
jgi:hypothetical protein